MTCTDVQRVLPELLEDAPDGEFQTAFEAHAKSCPACADLVSDLKLISSEAQELAESDEPAPRVWVRIAAELRAEGIIRDSEPAPARPVLVPASARHRWLPTAWWLAPVAACLLAAGAYFVNHHSLNLNQGPAGQVAKETPAAPVTAGPVTAGPAATAPVETARVTPAAVPAEVTPQVAPPKKPKPVQSTEVAEAKSTVEPGPSAEDQQFLTEVSTRAPSMRATYENQLQAVNANIREVQDYLQRNPRDADARQQLMDAYQQKALLYQIALDRIQ